MLLVTYGLRGHEVAAITLDDIDWKRDRVRVPERKAGHSTGYPLSATVGAALLDYLQHGRPKTTERCLFLRGLAPNGPVTAGAVSGRASYYFAPGGNHGAEGGVAQGRFKGGLGADSMNVQTVEIVRSPRTPNNYKSQPSAPILHGLLTTFLRGFMTPP